MKEETQGDLFGEPSSVKKAAASGPASGKKKSPAKKGRAGKPHGRGREKARREFSAGFILFRQTSDGPRYLLLDYGKHWDYAKGHLEDGETAWQAAVRELREETGIRQVDRVTRFQRDMHYAFYSPRKGNVTKTVTYFLGRTRAEKVALSDEHSGFAWLGYDEAMRRLTYDNAREVLRAAHEALMKAIG